MHNVKKLIMGMLIASMVITPVSVTQAKTTYITINKKNFPDNEFRSFVKYYDKNKDGKLSSKEISKVEKMYIDFDKLSIPEMKGYANRAKDLTGLNYFKNIKQLDIQNSEIKTLKLKLPKLEKLKLYCSNLKTLKLSGGKNLTAIDLDDYNGNRDLQLSKFPNMQSFTMSSDELIEYDELGLEKCKKLEDIFLINQVKADKIDLRKNSELVRLELDGDVKKIDCTGLKKVEKLVVDDIGLEELKVKGCKKLSKIYSESNPLTKMDVTGLKALTELRVDDNVKVIGANDDVIK